MADEESKYHNFTVAQLKSELLKYGLPTSGKKQELVDRLCSYFQKIDKSGTADASTLEIPSGSSGANSKSSAVKMESQTEVNNHYQDLKVAQAGSESAARGSPSTAPLNVDYSKLAEDERRKIRMMRFGTDEGVSSTKSPPDDPEKLASRAARFGIVNKWMGCNSSLEEGDRVLLLRKQRFEL